MDDNQSENKEIIENILKTLESSKLKSGKDYFYREGFALIIIDNSDFIGDNKEINENKDSFEEDTLKPFCKKLGEDFFVNLAKRWQVKFPLLEEELIYIYIINVYRLLNINSERFATSGDYYEWLCKSVIDKTKLDHIIHKYHSIEKIINIIEEPTDIDWLRDVLFSINKESKGYTIVNNQIVFLSFEDEKIIQKLIEGKLFD